MTKPTGRKPGRPRKRRPPGRPRDLDPKKKVRLLRLIRDGYPVDLAASKIGTTGRTVENESRRDPAFGIAVADARLQPRAVVERRVFLDAKKAGNVRSQALYLKGNWPEKYGDKIEFSGLTLDVLIMKSFETEAESK